MESFFLRISFVVFSREYGGEVGIIGLSPPRGGKS